MDFAMLAVAVALTAPMIADAATYRLTYEGSATFESEIGNPMPSDIFSSRDGTHTLELSFLLDIPDGGGSIYTGFLYSGGTVLGDPTPFTMEYVSLDGQRYDTEESDSFVEVSEFAAYMRRGEIRAEVSGAGELVDAYFWLSDYYHYWTATPGSYEVEDVYFAKALFTGPGEFTLTDVTPAAVPLPATAPLLLVGLGAMGWARKRKGRH